MVAEEICGQSARKPHAERDFKVNRDCHDNMSGLTTIFLFFFIVKRKVDNSRFSNIAGDYDLKQDTNCIHILLERMSLKRSLEKIYFQNKPIIQEYAEKLRAEFEQEKKRAVNVATRFDVFKEIDLI